MNKLRYIFSVCMLLVSFSAAAQDDEGDPLAPDLSVKQIPTDSLIDITITQRDASALEYYVLYTFQYQYSPKEKLKGEIMLPKKYDIYKDKRSLKLKLCIVTSFINSYKGVAGPPMEVGDYVQITGDDGKKHYFNFDPELPDPVFTICDNNK